WLNIRKVTAQRAENNQKNYKKDNFYIISIEIVFFLLILNLFVPASLSFNFKIKIDRAPIKTIKRFFTY
ncbi:hypothetical protein H6M06_00860, partial [Staphylococcus epidermidis]|nr:hypothetical protein [Staphylococcus epidermidis]